MIICKFATGKAIPCCWALLPNKSEDAYQLMLDAVLRKVNRDGRDYFKPSPSLWTLEVLSPRS
jgi:hypothetical protein